ncbi:TPA: BglG family transcription antiterminator [Enterococcus faecium]|nr:PTS sugar transporter subunit IIA [Enterococcus faecium]
MNTKDLKLLETIVRSHVTNSQQLKSLVHFSTRQITYSIKKINDELSLHGLSLIKRSNSGEWLYEANDLQKLLIYMNQAMVFKEGAIPEYINDDLAYSEIRRYSELLFILANHKKVTTQEIMAFIGISKNTARNDFSKIKKELPPDYTLIFDPQNGYMIESSMAKLHTLLLEVFNYLFERHATVNRFESLFSEEREFVGFFIHTYEQTFKLKFSDNSLTKLYYLIGLSLSSFKRRTKGQIDFSYDLQELDEFQMIRSCIDQHYQHAEIAIDYEWLTLLFLSFNTISNEFEILDSRIYQVIMEMITLFQSKSAIRISNKEELTNRLMNHLRPAIYRIRYELPFEIDDLAEIVKENHEVSAVLNFVKESIVPLEAFLRKTIPETELYLISVYFCSELLNSSIIETPVRKKAIVVCSNGLIMANVMAKTLKEIFPDIQFVASSSVREMDKFVEDVDLIFSNQPLKSEIPLYIIQPIMNEEEKNRLRNRVLIDFSTNNISKETRNLTEIIKRYSAVQNEESLQTDIERFLINYANSLIYLDRQSKQAQKISFVELLVSEGIILVSTKQLTWQNAMELSCQPLLKEQVINQNYQTILMSQMADEEAYYFLNNRIAIPHSSPENGVIKGGCSLLISVDPIIFPGNRPIHFISPFAIGKKENYLLAINQLLQLSKDEEYQQEILLCTTEDEVRKKIKNFLRRKQYVNNEFS